MRQDCTSAIYDLFRKVGDKPHLRFGRIDLYRKAVTVFTDVTVSDCLQQAIYNKILFNQ